jgi:hypothetical protein
MRPSHGWIGALSRSISAALIAKIFALVLPSFGHKSTHKPFLVACRTGSERQCDGYFSFLILGP